MTAMKPSKVGQLALPVLVAWAQMTGAGLAGPEVTSGPRSGSLVIMGGGGPDKAFGDIFGRFVALAGGASASLVIVTTAASSDPDHDYTRSGAAVLARKTLGVKDVVVLHTHDRKVAESEGFVVPLRRASGVWFGGGRQWRLAKAYGGTRTERELHGVLQRGGAIGGSSAGATIQGSFLVRGDTSGNTIMIGDHQRGFGFLRNAAIDQHLMARGRERDLLEVLEDPEGRMRPELNRKNLLGIGIDEDVAIVVRGEVFEVVGKEAGQVLIYDPRRWTPDMRDEQKWIALETGASFDLRKRTVLTETAAPDR